MLNAPKFKVYCLIGPEDSEIRYIGITSRSIEKRLSEHLQKAKYKQTYKDCWISSLLAKNITPRIEIIDEIDDYKFWEPYYISLYRSWGFKLTNSTDGGENGEISLEARKKISIKLQGNSHGFKKGNIPISAFTKGHTIIKKGSIKSNEHKKNIGISMINKGNVPVCQYDINGNFIRDWISATAVEKETGILNSKINMVCKGTRNKAGGFIWKYKSI